MRHPLAIPALLTAATLLLAGCRGPAPTTQPANPLVKATTREAGDADAVPQGPFVAHLELFQIDVAYGTASRNEEFWKHVTEPVIDISIHDLLLKNGLRAGFALQKDWDYFRRILEESPEAQTRRSAFQARTRLTQEIVLKPDVREQRIAWFNRTNNLEVRSFGKTANILAVEFQPLARKPGEVRVRLCPVCRTWRAELRIVARDDEEEIKYVHPERFYDLGFEVDIPANAALIVGPSSEATWPFSLGHNFLVDAGAVRRTEQILIFVPTVLTLDGRPIRPATRPMR